MEQDTRSITSAFSFELPTKIRFGKGSAESLPHELSSAGFKRALMISDSGVSRLPFYAKIIEALRTEGLQVGLYDGVEANPKDTNVRDAAKAARELGADCIVAVGGGSPIDCAKATSIVAARGGRVRDYEGGKNIDTPGLPLYTVPTTSGTGSEITFSSVITDTEEKFKFTVKSPLIAPKAAFLDPDLTLSMPPELTASTGLDALTHAVEAFTAANAEPLSDAAALYAVELISTHLLPAIRDGKDEVARAGMLNGSLLAGIAFSHSDVASVHCLAEALGGLYDAPHGVCNAVALPVVMGYNLEYAPNRYARLAAAMGETYSGVENGAAAAVEKVRSLVEASDLPSFRSLGVKEEDFQDLAAKAAQNGSNSSNPRPMRKEDYLELLERLVSG